MTIEKARTFIHDPDLLGKQFLSKYTADHVKHDRPSGIFLLGNRSMAVTSALFLRMVNA